MGKRFTDKELKSNPYKYSLKRMKVPKSKIARSIMIIFNIAELLY